MRISDWSSDVCSSDLRSADSRGRRLFDFRLNHSDVGGWANDRTCPNGSTADSLPRKGPGRGSLDHLLSPCHAHQAPMDRPFSRPYGDRHMITASLNSRKRFRSAEHPEGKSGVITGRTRWEPS